MSLTPRHSPQVCTHERGVGTTVCLHCRKEARLAAHDRRRRLMLRGAAGAIVVATGLAATALGATAIRDRKNLPKHNSAVEMPATGDGRPATGLPGASDRQRVTREQRVDSAKAIAATTPAAAAAPSAPKVAAAKLAAPLPVVQMGISTISDGISAERTDSAVTLSFDTPLMRTRRSEKFEQFVRATLPTVYGKNVESALTAMPPGAFAKQGDLLTELPTRGVRIPVDSAWEIRVFPETRKGVEGPLVVRYRASAVAR